MSERKWVDRTEGEVASGGFVGVGTITLVEGELNPFGDTIDFDEVFDNGNGATILLPLVTVVAEYIPARRRSHVGELLFGEDRLAEFRESPWDSEEATTEGDAE